jgi:hypothetical protein
MAGQSPAPMPPQAFGKHDATEKLLLKLNQTREIKNETANPSPKRTISLHKYHAKIYLKILP